MAASVLSQHQSSSHSSKLFGTQRLRTYRASNVGSYSSYESSAPGLEQSFHSTRTSRSQTDVSTSSPSRRGTSVDRDVRGRLESVTLASLVSKPEWQTLGAKA